jgi:hypothetical protein
MDTAAALAPSSRPRMEGGRAENRVITYAACAAAFDDTDTVFSLLL